MLITLLLTATTAIVGWFTYQTIAHPPKTQLVISKSTPAFQRKQPAKTNRGDAKPKSLTEFSELVDRPLFSQSRRPVTSSEPGPVIDTPVLSSATSAVGNQYQVMAIVIRDQEKAALLASAGDKGEILKVKEGQLIAGWKVTAITPEALTIQRGNEQATIQLKDNVLSEAEKRRLAQEAKREQALAKRKSARKLPVKRPQPKTRRSSTAPRKRTPTSTLRRPADG